jgi:phage terminase small subunit
MRKPKESTRTRRTNQIELFCLDYFKTGNATLSARNVGYAPKYADRTASRLLDRPYVVERLKQLRQKAEDDSIATVIERKQILTKVLRTNLTDFMELGADGSWVNLGPETKNAEAISEIHSRTEYDDDGAHSTVHTSVKLHDKLKAADLLNKMDGIYV